MRRRSSSCSIGVGSGGCFLSGHDCQCFPSVSGHGRHWHRRAASGRGHVLTEPVRGRADPR
eukprot:8798765-Pyramimonas_sp.AAC.1